MFGGRDGLAHAPEAPEQIETFVRYSEQAADGGWIEKNGSYSFEIEDHDVVVRNARLADTSWEGHCQSNCTCSKSSPAAIKDLGVEDRREIGRWLNNRAENSHPTLD
jgi:hypothetical protein